MLSLRPSNLRWQFWKSTGGLQTPLVSASAAAAAPVVVVNPRPVRGFTKSTGQLAKTDRLDALILAHFGEAVHPPMRPLWDADTQAFSALPLREASQNFRAH